MFALNLLNKLIKKSRRLAKKTKLPFFQRFSTRLEEKKKRVIFSAIDALGVKPSVNEPAVAEPTRIVWICWLQGREHAPELVKRCIASVEENAVGAKVVVLTDETIPQYLTLPEHIVQKYQQGRISKAPYSDIVRCSLLYQYGGIWMDATMFLTRPIPESLFAREFSSLRFDLNKEDNALSQGFWTTYLLASHKHNSLVKYVRDVLYAYWLQDNELIEYFLTDYSFRHALEHYAEFRTLLLEQPVIGNNRFLIRQFMNKKADGNGWAALRDDAVGIYKLSHKETYQTEDNQQPTLYAQILKGEFSLN